MGQAVLCSQPAGLRKLAADALVILRLRLGRREIAAELRHEPPRIPQSELCTEFVTAACPHEAIACPQPGSQARAATSSQARRECAQPQARPDPCGLSRVCREVWLADDVLWLLREVAWPVLRCFLPYADLIRRVRLRSAAFKLVDCEPWPEEEATGPDAAKLALLRMLFLQREVRRAVRWRQREAAALLARSATETCMVGLYCLHNNDAPKSLEGRDAVALAGLLRYLVEAGLVSQAVVDAAVGSLDTGARLPRYSQMAESIPEGRDREAADNAYRRFYVPLSHFFTHASAFTLMRHVRPDRTLHRRPASPWPRRSPVRLADGCAGVIAAAIATQAGKAEADARFTSYAIAHLERAVTPVFAVGGIGFLRGANWGRLPGAFRAARQTRAYLIGPARSVPQAEREARVREALTVALQVLRQDQRSAALIKLLVDDLTARVLREMHTEPQPRG
jgi:hypothetical protein